MPEIITNEANKNACLSEQPSYFDVFSTYSYLISIGVRPVVEMSFTPSPVVNKTGACAHFYYDGCEVVPYDLPKYHAIIKNFTAALVDYFGVDEVALWYFEVYNEADLHWSFEQYFDLYSAAATAVKSVSGKLRVGGPASAFPIWIKNLVAACKNSSTPIDFASSHGYPTTGGAKNAEMKGLMKQVQTAREYAGDLPLLITEWNGVCNSRGQWHDETAQPAFLVAAVDAVAAVTPKLEMFAYWAISDVFTEMGLPAQPVAFHGGFGLISLYGVEKPGFQAFKWLNAAGDLKLASTATATATTTAAHGASSRTPASPSPAPAPPPTNLTVVPLLDAKSGRLRIFLAADGYVGEPVANRSITLYLQDGAAAIDAVVEETGVVPSCSSSVATLWRIDENHTNPKALWQSMGSPNYLKPSQVAKLKEASKPVPTAVTLSKVTQPHAGWSIQLDLPAFGLAVLDVDVTAHRVPI